MWWNDQFIDELEAKLNDNVAVAAQSLQQSIRENIDTSSRPSRSKPGEFPHKDTQALQESVRVDHNPSQLSARIGTMLPHGAFLEFGTNRMAARPWLVRTLIDQQQVIFTILAGVDPQK